MCAFSTVRRLLSVDFKLKEWIRWCLCVFCLSVSCIAKMKPSVSHETKKPTISAYHPTATWTSDFRVLFSMLFANVKGETQQERLESFYDNQADLYDSYRHRMLHARLPMISAMPAPAASTWVDIGGGTGSNLEFFQDEPGLRHFSKVVVLDLCPSLVKIAQKRVLTHADWQGLVSVILGDACDFNCPGLPEAGTVDIVTFSYALTMIPDWKKALQNAYRLLRPGGHIAVCDFTTSEEQWFGMATFWTWLFSNDHVHLRAQHVETLQKAFRTVELKRGFGTFPYVPPLLQAPWYYFIGCKVDDLPSCSALD